MTILEAKHIAQEKGFDRTKFKLIRKGGATLKCEWIDAFLGLFKSYDPPMINIFKSGEFNSPEMYILMEEENDKHC